MLPSNPENYEILKRKPNCRLYKTSLKEPVPAFQATDKAVSNMSEVTFYEDDMLPSTLYLFISSVLQLFL
jgi:hypothetical protein